MTAIDKLDANMKKNNRSNQSLTRKATSDSMSSAVKGGAQPVLASAAQVARAKSPPSNFLPPPEKKASTPSKPIFSDFDDPSNRLLLEEAKQFANEARMREKNNKR